MNGTREKLDLVCNRSHIVTVSIITFKSQGLVVNLNTIETKLYMYPPMPQGISHVHSKGEILIKGVYHNSHILDTIKTRQQIITVLHIYQLEKKTQFPYNTMILSRFFHSVNQYVFPRMHDTSNIHYLLRNLRRS